MNETISPAQCQLCDSCSGIVPAEFHQVYRQKDSAPILLDWWECCNCRGWFVYPVPTPQAILRNCGTAAYNDPNRVTEIGQAKEAVHKRILEQLSKWTKPGALLDFGCNFGHFLVMARDAGWTACGFEPGGFAAEAARIKGFDVSCGWSLEEAGFPEGHFAAITANDSFYYAWNPNATLRIFQHLLKPEGVLAMRLTNKRFILGLVRAFSTSSSRRDAQLSRILQGQFHSISIGQFTPILRCVGFDRIHVGPGAVTALWCDLSRRAQAAYLAAQLAYVLTLSKVNISPGVLLFARKAAS